MTERTIFEHLGGADALRPLADALGHHANRAITEEQCQRFVKGRTPPSATTEV